MERMNAESHPERRVCVGCGETKPPCCFYKNGLGGIRRECKTCYSAKTNAQKKAARRSAPHIKKIAHAEQQLRRIIDGPWRKHP